MCFIQVIGGHRKNPSNRDDPQRKFLMGFIYKISTKTSNKVYIGQTRGTITHRYGQHTSGASAIAKGNRPNGSGICTKLYRAMNKYGTSMFTIESVIEVPNEDLNFFEELFIVLYDSVINGYNLTWGGDSAVPSDETKARISFHIQMNRWIYIDSFRKHEGSKGLPMYMGILTLKTDGCEGYRIVRHPMCKKKHFSTKKHYSSMESAKYACLAFLEWLNKQTTPYEGSRTRTDLPLGISEITNGYRVRKIVDPEYPRIDKAFASQSDTMKVKLRKAIQYLRSVEADYFFKLHPEVLESIGDDPLGPFD